MLEVDISVRTRNERCSVSTVAHGHYQGLSRVMIRPTGRVRPTDRVKSFPISPVVESVRVRRY